MLATLRQMLALLETERQALAALDLDASPSPPIGQALDLCAELETAEHDDLDEECPGLVDAVRGKRTR